MQACSECQHILRQVINIATVSGTPWVWCSRHPDRLGRTHFRRAILATHLLVIPVVMTVIPRHCHKILVPLDETVALGGRVCGAVLDILVDTEHIALAVKIRPGRRLIRRSQFRTYCRVQGVVLVIKPGTFRATIRVYQILDIADVTIRKQPTRLHPVHVTQEGGTNGLLVLLIDRWRKEATNLIQTEHALVGVGAKLVAVAACTITGIGRLALIDRRGNTGIGLPAILYCCFAFKTDPGFASKIDPPFGCLV